jgi:hypothetical protein
MWLSSAKFTGDTSNKPRRKPEENQKKPKKVCGNSVEYEEILIKIAVTLPWRNAWS